MNKTIIEDIEYVFVANTARRKIISTIDDILQKYHYMQGLRKFVRLRNEKYILIGEDDLVMSVWIPTWDECKRLKLV